MVYSALLMASIRACWMASTSFQKSVITPLVTKELVILAKVKGNSGSSGWGACMTLYLMRSRNTDTVGESNQIKLQE